MSRRTFLVRAGEVGAGRARSCSRACPAIDGHTTPGTRRTTPPENRERRRRQERQPTTATSSRSCRGPHAISALDVAASACSSSRTWSSTRRARRSTPIRASCRRRRRLAPGRRRSRSSVGEGPGPPSRHRVPAASTGLYDHLRRRAHPLRRSQSGRCAARCAEEPIHRARRSLRCRSSSCRRLHRLDAEAEDASLGGRDAALKNLFGVRAGARLRLAEEHPALCRHRTRRSSISPRPFVRTTPSSTASSAWRATGRSRERPRRRGCSCSAMTRWPPTPWPPASWASIPSGSATSPRPPASWARATGTASTTGAKTPNGSRPTSPSSPSSSP